MNVEHGSRYDEYRLSGAMDEPKECTEIAWGPVDIGRSCIWSRELRMASLGLPAVLLPPEEEKEIKTAIGAAHAKKGRKAIAQAALQGP